MESRSRAVPSKSRIPSGSREASGPTMRRARRFRGPSRQVQAEGPSDSGIVNDDGPAAIPLSTARESGFPEILRSDPCGAGVDEHVLRMEESIAFHDVLSAGHPADVDTGRGEPATHIVFVAIDASDRTSVEEDSDTDASAG